ncbi:hypothetical protein JA1_003215 [Spathaspora sp. JA1]|nr:hypothetical protein JA1_003215 [Spathaspora sp. JA1]
MEQLVPERGHYKKFTEHAEKVLHVQGRKLHAANELLQGHINSTGVCYGGWRPSCSDTSITKSGYVYAQSIFREWFKFLGIENYDIVPVSKEKVAKEIDVLVNANGDYDTKAAGKLKLPSELVALLYDMVLSENSNMGCCFDKLVLGKLVIKTHKIASKRKGNNRIHDLMLVPYNALRYDVLDRFSTTGLNKYKLGTLFLDEFLTNDVKVKCGRCINLINSDPFANVFKTSTRVNGAMNEYVSTVA